MALIEVKVPDIGDFKDVAVIELLVKVGDRLEIGTPLTNDPNVGGFGQVDAEVVLQNPVRIYGLLALFALVALAQILLVLKKRQVEKVQAAEGIL